MNDRRYPGKAEWNYANELLCRIYLGARLNTAKRKSGLIAWVAWREMKVHVYRNKHGATYAECARKFDISIERARQLDKRVCAYITAMLRGDINPKILSPTFFQTKMVYPTLLALETEVAFLPHFIPVYV